MQAGLCTSGTISHERRACPRPIGTRNYAGRTSSVQYEFAQKEGCPRPAGMRNQASGTLSVRYDVARREGSSSSVRYNESSRWDFARPLQSCVKGEHVLARLVWGIKQVGQHPSGSKSRNESLSTFIRYEESTILHQMAPGWGCKYCILPCIHQSSPCAEYDPKHQGGWSTNQ